MGLSFPYEHPSAQRSVSWVPESAGCRRVRQSARPKASVGQATPTTLLPIGRQVMSSRRSRERVWPDSNCPSTSVGRRWMADCRQREMDDSAVIVDAIPDAACARDFELPLLEDPATDGARPEVTLQRMLTGARAARVRAKGRPGCQSGARRRCTEFLPALGRCAVAKAKIPLSIARRRRDTFAASTQSSPSRPVEGPDPHLRAQDDAVPGRASDLRRSPRSHATLAVLVPEAP